MKVAVVGATGAVGRKMLEELEAFDQHKMQVRAFASSKSAGQILPFAGGSISVETFCIDTFEFFDFVLLAAGGEFSRLYAPELASRGMQVIDNSSVWRMNTDVPLVVPEVNGHILDRFSQGIIANPNCSTIQLTCSLAPLQQEFGLELVNVVTFQSVSGSGQKGIEELESQSKECSLGQEPTPQLYDKPIAFNILPAIGPIDSWGHCEEEIKMVRETRKILNLPNLNMMATTTRVPVFNCHCEAITVKLSKEVNLKTLRSFWQECWSDHGDYRLHEDGLVSPTEVTGERGVILSRLRLPFESPQSRWLQFWNVADNLKKGAATNGVQILKRLINLA